MTNAQNSANYGFEMKSDEIVCGSPRIPSYFFNHCWDNSVDQNDPFESALSSMVSSPTVGIPTCGTVAGDGKTIVMSELMGQLGGMSNNIGDMSSHSSCYNTPLNSPPKMRGNFPIPSFSPDLGFAERAARFSSFNNNFNGNMPKLEPPISQSGKTAEFVDSREGSSVSYQISGGESGNARKRKSTPKGKSNHNPSPSSSSSAPSKDGKVKTPGEEHDESTGKRSKTNEGNDNKDNSKPPEPEPSTKDYIHVRARRGQATDSHSLAERVRREKISERMKFLQDLVPGCNKVTGKAVMLDEIINYVQSLQRQVEFLSMKLSTLNPRILSNNNFQSSTFYGTTMNNALQLPPVQSHVDLASFTQAATLWDDELHTVVKMGFGKNLFQTS